MAEGFKAPVLKTGESQGSAGSNPALSEFQEKRIEELEWFETHPHTVPSRKFLDRLLTLSGSDTLFFEERDEVRVKRLASKLRTRLWRYQAAGYIQKDSFHCLKVEGGYSVFRSQGAKKSGKKFST